jgi:hypothetical protein
VTQGRGDRRTSTKAILSPKLYELSFKLGNLTMCSTAHQNHQTEQHATTQRTLPTIDSETHLKPTCRPSPAQSRQNTPPPRSCHHHNQSSHATTTTNTTPQPTHSSHDHTHTPSTATTTHTKQYCCHRYRSNTRQYNLHTYATS